MPRYKLTLEYDGALLVGWQKQKNGVSVQSLLEKAALHLADQAVEIVGAGRTDAGVHACGQVAHLDLQKALAADRLRDALNFWLCEESRTTPVAVLRAEIVPADFHARFSAIGRRYCYRIINRRAPLTLARSQAWQVVKPLDAAAMHQAAQILVGTHDFTSFRATECQAKSPIKSLDRLDVTRQDDEIHIVAQARSFLHHQVRNMVGSLKWIGEGRWTEKNLTDALAARERSKGGPTAPADGLMLTEVIYPPLS